MRDITPRGPGWLKRQFDAAEKTVSQWPLSKRVAAGIPGAKEEWDRAQAIAEFEVYWNDYEPRVFADEETIARDAFLASRGLK